MIFLPTNLRYLRETRGLTQTQLAEIIGVRPNTVSNYENGNSSPDFAVLGEIVKVLDTDAHSLLFRDLRPGAQPLPQRPEQTRRVSDISGFYDAGGREGEGTPGPEVPGAANRASAEQAPQVELAGSDYGRRLAEMALEIDKLKEMIRVLQEKMGI